MSKVKGMLEESMIRNPELYNGKADYEFWVQCKKESKQTKIKRKGRSVKCQIKKKK